MNVKFKMPVEIIMSENCLSAEIPALATYGQTAALMIDLNACDASGVLVDLIPALEQAGISYIRFDAPQNAACMEYVLQTALEVRKASVDMVIAVGDTRIVDAGKVVATLAAQDTMLAESDVKAGKLAPNALPLIAVATSPEVPAALTPFAVMTDTQGEIFICSSETFFAKQLLIDPGYARRSFWRVFASSAFEAIGNVVEICTSVNDSCRFALPLAKGSFAELRLVLLSMNEDDINDYTIDLLVSSGLKIGLVAGLTGMSHFRLMACHLAAVMGISCGRAIRLLLIPYLRVVQRKKPYLVDSIIHALGFPDLSGFEKLISDVMPEKEQLSEVSIEKVRKQILACDAGDQCAIALTEQEIDEILMQI